MQPPISAALSASDRSANIQQLSRRGLPERGDDPLSDVLVHVAKDLWSRTVPASTTTLTSSRRHERVARSHQGISCRWSIRPGQERNLERGVLTFDQPTRSRPWDVSTVSSWMPAHGMTDRPIPSAISKPAEPARMNVLADSATRKRQVIMTKANPRATDTPVVKQDLPENPRDANCPERQRADPLRQR